MIYELRIYDVVPGRLPALHDRISKYVLALFKKHGIKPVGYWTDEIGTSNRLTYLLVFDDMADRERKFKALMSDPEYVKVREVTEAEGPIVAQARNYLLRPTPYSPLQ